MRIYYDNNGYPGNITCNVVDSRQQIIWSDYNYQSGTDIIAPWVEGHGLYRILFTKAAYQYHWFFVTRIEVE